MIVLILLMLCFSELSDAKTASAIIAPLVQVPSGNYIPFISGAVKSKINVKRPIEPVHINKFQMSTTAITNRDFISFVRQNPQWSKSRIKRLFADEQYLAQWETDFSLKNLSEMNSPVVNVSWFAAEAYCESKGLSLPTTDQWEYALKESGRSEVENNQEILSWYSQPNLSQLPSVGTGKSNSFGLYNMFGLVWEWTLDFNSFMVSEESRDTGGKDNPLFCGGASEGTTDYSNYAAFMRYSFRSSLRASYVTNNLGFRCASGENK